MIRVNAVAHTPPVLDSLLTAMDKPFNDEGKRRNVRLTTLLCAHDFIGMQHL